MKANSKESVQEKLFAALEVAMDTLQPKSKGITWSVEQFLGSGANVGKVKLLDGRIAMVKIEIEADPDELDDEELNKVEFLEIE